MMDSQQLSHVESLCDALYNSPNASQRSTAQQQLMSLQSSVDYVPQCQYMLDHSKNAYAQLLASNSLTHLVTTYWNSFSTHQCVDLRNYILNLLASNGPQLTDYVKTSLITLVCRITKLGWFKDNALRDLFDESMKFLSASVDHYIIGLRILNQLVEEINIPNTGRTLPQHRKTAVAFRDSSLQNVFNVALTALKHIQTGSMSPLNMKQEISIGESALQLSQKCLSYDFIGTNPDESSEDVGTIQVPSSWRDTIVDPATLNLFFDFYKKTDPPRSSLAMQNIILLSSVRRSIFPKDTDRAAFLQSLMDFIREILSSQHGLQHPENYHEFCRQLGRIKASYQLNELVRVDGYLEWVELAGNFTVRSFQQWRWSVNSVHYLLTLWGRLVAAVPYVRPEVGAQSHTQRLQECVQLVMQCYVQSMVDSVETVMISDGAVDDPLDDDGSLKEQLDKLPTIGRFDYSPLASFILNLFDPLLVQYEEAIQRLGNQILTTSVIQRLSLLEGKLTWLVYICAALVGGYSWSDACVQDGEESIDASLCRRIFQLAQGVDFRLNSTAGQGKCSQKLEVALLYFFQVYRRMYMWEQHAVGTTTLTTILMTGSIPVRAEYSGPSTKQKVFRSFFEHLALGDSDAVSNIIISKIGNNLKYWSCDDDVISGSLQLFMDMASSYPSSKQLLNLENVAFLIQNHTEEHFPFLSLPANMRNRSTFHMTLAKLIFASSEMIESLFDSFMDPLFNVLKQLAATSNFRQESVKRAIIGICRDLRGICSATSNKRTYTMVFEALYPDFFPIFTRAAEEWADSSQVGTSLLKFIQEFTNNRGQRLVFDQSSPNGILLFRESSNIICIYGNRLANSASFVNAVNGPSGSENAYKEAYKGAALCMNALTTALSGGYVNFGVFALYGDKALDNALETVLKLAFLIPLSEILSFPKLSKAYFSLFDILFRNHIQLILQLDTPVFMQIMTALHEGLQSLDAPLSAQCALVIDHLATFHFNKGQKDTPASRALQAHLQSNPNLLAGMLSTLFNLLLFDNATSQTANQWAVTRPILSLIFADEMAFNRYQDHLISSQSNENAHRLKECFDKLLADFQKNLDNANRDRFTQRLTLFRISARQFLTL